MAQTTKPIRFVFPILLLIAANLACNAHFTSTPATTAPPLPTSTQTAATVATAPPPATPTALVTATPATAEQCPAPGNAQLPAVPPPFPDTAKTIQDYLSSGGLVEGLQTALVAWGGITEQAGKIISDRDLTGDGMPEIIVAVQESPAQFTSGGPYPPGDLYVYGCQGGGYAILYGDYSTPDRLIPDIVTVQDINQDGLSELLYSTHVCGASTCVYELHDIEWSPPSKVFSQLLDVQNIPDGSFEVQDNKIITHYGPLGSAGAGPQRLHDEIYAWSGGTYQLESSVITTPKNEWFPIHYIEDGDAALDKGDPAGAIAIYTEMLNLPNPLILISADEVPALKAYAHYRIMLAQVRLGDVSAAKATHDALMMNYPDPNQPGGGFAALADAFWQVYSTNPDAAAACTAAISYARTNPDSYTILNGFGYGNRQYQPTDLCPFH